jgi:hypothetical protein
VLRSLPYALKHVSSLFRRLFHTNFSSLTSTDVIISQMVYLSLSVFGDYLNTLCLAVRKGPKCQVTFCILASCGGTISTHSLFSVTTTRKENSVFSTTCFDLLKSYNKHVTDRVQLRQTLVMLPCIVISNR